MQCTGPLFIEGSQVACGQCLACRLNRARDDSVRCIHERSSWKKAAFVTLTYNDQDLPSDYALDRVEFTKFWKRLRRAVDPEKLKYYACGEYGEKDGRPHYHAIIFGVSPSEGKLVERCWGHGFVYMGTAQAESMRYVAYYVRKAVGNLTGAEAYTVLMRLSRMRVPAFIVMSQGIGRGFVDANRDLFLRQGYVTVGGKPQGMPTYYRRRLKERKVLDDLWLLGEFSDREDDIPENGPELREQRAKNIVAASAVRNLGRV